MSDGIEVVIVVGAFSFVVATVAMAAAVVLVVAAAPAGGAAAGRAVVGWRGGRGDVRDLRSSC
jgi:hypothetical protein